MPHSLKTGAASRIRSRAAAAKTPTGGVRKKASYKSDQKTKAAKRAAKIERFADPQLPRHDRALKRRLVRIKRGDAMFEAEKVEKTPFGPVRFKRAFQSDHRAESRYVEKGGVIEVITAADDAPKVQIAYVKQTDYVPKGQSLGLVKPKRNKKGKMVTSGDPAYSDLISEFKGAVGAKMAAAVLAEVQETREQFKAGESPADRADRGDRKRARYKKYKPVQRAAMGVLYGVTLVSEDARNAGGKPMRQTLREVAAGADAEKAFGDTAQTISMETWRDAMTGAATKGQKKRDKDMSASSDSEDDGDGQVGQTPPRRKKSARRPTPDPAPAAQRGGRKRGRDPAEPEDEPHLTASRVKRRRASPPAPAPSHSD